MLNVGAWLANEFAEWKRASGFLVRGQTDTQPRDDWPISVREYSASDNEVAGLTPASSSPLTTTGAPGAPLPDLRGSLDTLRGPLPYIAQVHREGDIWRPANETTNLCVGCSAKATVDLVFTGTGYGDPSLDTTTIRSRRSRRRWFTPPAEHRPTQTFSVAVGICDRCVTLLTHRKSLATQAEPPLYFWFAIGLMFAVGAATLVLFVVYGLPWVVGLLATIPTGWLALRLVERVNAYVHSGAIRDRDEALRIQVAVSNRATTLLDTVKAEVEKALREDQLRALESVEALQRLGGHRFEGLITRLFAQMGYETRKTRGSGDGGIDIHATRQDRRIIIQCKNYRHPASPAVVRELYGTLTATHADKGILICTGGFGEGAQAFARDKPLELLNGDAIVRLLKGHGIVTMANAGPDQ